MRPRYALLRGVFRALQWYRHRAYVLVDLWGRDGFSDDLSPRGGLYGAYDRFMHSALFVVLIGVVAWLQNSILGWIYCQLRSAELDDWMKGLFR